MVFLNKSKTYSWIAIVLVFIGDILSLIEKEVNWPFLRYSILGVFALIVIVWLVGWFRKIKFGIKSTVLVKLLSNVTGPRPLSVLYLLLFVLHIGWLGNILNGSEHIVSSLFICILFIIVLIIFFPGRQENKDANATKVFVSGVSALNYNNRNITPLVRILQRTNNEDCCEMIVLYSNYYSKEINKKWISDNIDKYFAEAYDEATQFMEPTFRQITEEIKNGQDIKEKMKLLVRIWAFHEFPEKRWLLNPSKFIIYFTSKDVDYNDFKDCFDTMERELQGKDDAAHVLYFNITPGTANISSLMTLMAIDGDRELLYYIPENDPTIVAKMSPREKELRLKGVPKKEMSLENLLSQAIETLNK